MFSVFDFSASDIVQAEVPTLLILGITFMYLSELQKMARLEGVSGTPVLVVVFCLFLFLCFVLSILWSQC